MLHHIIFAMGIGRIALGLIPFLAAKKSAKILGFPAAHDTATTRLMARFFGVRDVGLGVLVFYALAHPATLPFILLFNACMDLGDLSAISIPLLKRQGIDRAAWTSVGFALPAAIAWLTVLSQSV
jgi:Domain of unknown function (DUF4267)